MVIKNRRVEVQGLYFVANKKNENLWIMMNKLTGVVCCKSQWKKQTYSGWQIWWKAKEGAWKFTSEGRLPLRDWAMSEEDMRNLISQSRADGTLNTSIWTKKRKKVKEVKSNSSQNSWKYEKINSIMKSRGVSDFARETLCWKYIWYKPVCYQKYTLYQVKEFELRKTKRHCHKGRTPWCGSFLCVL